MALAVEDRYSHSLLAEDELRRLARNAKSLIPVKSQQKLSQPDTNRFNFALEAVFQTAEARSINASHRVAAWNALCTLIDHTFELDGDHLTAAICVNDVWKRAFELYIAFSHNARPKSSKQLLNTLSATLVKAKKPAILREHVARRLIEGILNDGDPPIAKASMQLLAQFLSKQALLLREVLKYLHFIHQSGQEHDIRTLTQEFLKYLFMWVGKGDFGSVVGHVLSVILDDIGSVSRVSLGNGDITPARLDKDPLWMHSLVSTLGLRLVEIDDLRVHIFPVLFIRDLSQYIQFLNRRGLQQLCQKGETLLEGAKKSREQSDELLLVALQTGKELGLLYETEDSELSHTTLCIFIPIRAIERLISQHSRRARLTGLSLLITSHSATRPFLVRTMKLLRKRLHTYFADTDANFRSEVFGLMQKLVDRFRAVTAALARKGHNNIASNTTPNISAPAVLHNHHSFLSWLLSHLNVELRPTASYQRHISALKTLSIISRSGLDHRVPANYLSKSATAETKWPFHLQVMNCALRRLLLDLLLNPFDDVRQTSASILEIFSAAQDPDERMSMRKEVQLAIIRAENLMLLTGRADQADGVARLYALLFCLSSDPPCISEASRSSQPLILRHLLESLQHMLDVAKIDLSIAVTRHPVHGLLISLRYILTQDSGKDLFQGLTPRVVTCLYEVWEVVSPVLCNDAPEGHVPEEIDEMSDISTKDTLSYCWRALKESSLLLGAVVSSITLDQEVLLSLGDLCFRQLSELRHRGAFSTVAQTWIICCVKCSSLTTPARISVLNQWYNNVIYLLGNTTTINTRRSAGIPALLCGILVADETRNLLPQAFKDLAAIARLPVTRKTAEASSLPQVHAQNCIKDILKSTRLGEQSEHYVPLSLRLAAESLRSEAWAIRNCGLMLFRAVIDRLLGTSDTYLDDDISASSRLSAHEHPELFDAILHLLSTANTAFESESESTGSTEGVFPALQVLQRIDISHGERSKATKMVFELTGSDSWHLRDKAARIYARIVPQDEATIRIHDILDTLDHKHRAHNLLHGSLLCIKYLIRRQREYSSGTFGIPQSSLTRSLRTKTSLLREAIQKLFASSPLFHEDHCPFTKAAYVDTLVEVMEFVHNRSGETDSLQATTEWKETQFNVRHELQMLLSSKQGRGDEYVLRSALSRAFACELKKEKRDLIGTNYADEDDTVSLILMLARTDADACCVFFQSFPDNQITSVRDSSFVPRTVLRAGAAVLQHEVDVQLKTVVQRLLLDFADRAAQSNDAKIIFGSPFQTTSFAPALINSTQEFADQWLQLEAVALEHRLGIARDCNEDLELDLARWVQLCCAAIRGLGIFTREAAALAITRLSYSWQDIRDGPFASFCDLCFGVFDLLNDDEEEIRSLASTAATHILDLTMNTNRTGVLEPLCASERLAKWMVDRWANSPYFIEQVLERAFGEFNQQRGSVAEQLAHLETTDSALFVEERQNLYIDDAREVRLWSRVLLTVDSGVIPKAAIRCVSEWASQGLDVLTDKAEREKDGALGWTSMVEVFPLGLQVIYGVEFLLRIVEHGMKLPLRPSTLLLKLGKLGVACKSSAASPAWLREIERVMAWAVGCRLQRRKAVLEKMCVNFS